MGNGNGNDNICTFEYIFCQLSSMSEKSTSISKNKYRILLTEACHEKIKQLLKSTVKCGQIQKEDYEAPVDFKSTIIQDTRSWFKPILAYKQLFPKQKACQDRLTCPV